jgi:hypothetical protein
MSPIKPDVSPDPLTDESDGETNVTVIPKAHRRQRVCGVCRNTIEPFTKSTKRDELPAWIRPYKCELYHLGCIIKRLPVPDGITDPWSAWEYRRWPDNACCNKVSNIMYLRMKADGSREIRSWYKAPPPKPEPIVLLDGLPGWVRHLATMR